MKGFPSPNVNGKVCFSFTLAQILFIEVVDDFSAKVARAHRVNWLHSLRFVLEMNLVQIYGDGIPLASDNTLLFKYHQSLERCKSKFQ